MIVAKCGRRAFNYLPPAPAHVQPFQMQACSMCKAPNRGTARPFFLSSAGMLAVKSYVCLKLLARQAVRCTWLHDSSPGQRHRAQGRSACCGTERGSETGNSTSLCQAFSDLLAVAHLAPCGVRKWEAWHRNGIEVHLKMSRKALDVEELSRDGTWVEGSSLVTSRVGHLEEVWSFSQIWRLTPKTAVGRRWMGMPELHKEHGDLMRTLTNNCT